MSTLLLFVNAVFESVLHKFWDLEFVRILPKKSLNDDDTSNPVQDRFSESVRFIDGRYEVALPWKSDTARSQLQNNAKLAKRRLDNLPPKFQKDPDLRMKYDDVFKEYEKEDICEEVPSSEMETVHPTYYLPHHPVIRESSSSTKLRPFFCMLLHSAITVFH